MKQLSEAENILSIDVPHPDFDIDRDAGVTTLDVLYSQRPWDYREFEGEYITFSLTETSSPADYNGYEQDVSNNWFQFRFFDAQMFNLQLKRTLSAITDPHTKFAGQKAEEDDCHTIYERDRLISFNDEGYTFKKKINVFHDTRFSNEYITVVINSYYGDNTGPQSDFHYIQLPIEAAQTLARVLDTKVPLSKHFEN